MGNAGSLLNEILAEFNDDLLGDGEGGLSDGDNDGGNAGFMGTVRGGFDYQLDRIVLGVDAAFNFGQTDIDAHATGAAGADMGVSGDDSAQGVGFGNAAVSSSLELGNSWSVGARAGFLATDSTLIFGSAGYVSSHAKLNASYNGYAEAEASGSGDASGSAAAGFDISSSNSGWLDGYYVGGGVEQLLTSNISLKLEYRYSDLGSIETSDSEFDELGGPSSGGGAYWETGVAAEADPTVHSIMATINWRF